MIEIERLRSELGAARTLLEEWMLADERFDIESWAKRVRDMLEDSNPFNRVADVCHRCGVSLADPDHSRHCSADS
jgi:hypothetical protein